MIALLKKYWLKALVSIAVVVLTSYLSSLVTRIAYNKQIRASNKKIAELKQDMKDSSSRASIAIERAQTAEEEARAAIAEKERHKTNVARIEQEKRALKAQIAALPPTQVVVHTIEILVVEPEAITLRPQGVVFTLASARKNLEFLKSFTLIKRQFSELASAFVASEKSGIKLRLANSEMKTAIAEKDVQIASWPAIEREWDFKFNLSENRSKQNWWKGFKTGGTIGSIVFGIIGFVLGSR